MELRNGVKMPLIGLGTWQMNGEVCERSVYDAIEVGYRHIDSAEAYRNEVDVGWAVKRAIDDGLVKREELFIATKISDEANAGYDNVKRLVKSQLEALQVDYIDLYMLHSPLQGLQADTWRALEELYEQGVIKALGVSNFDSHELRSLVQSSKVAPMVVQNKLDVYHVGKQLDNRADELVATCRELGIILVSYSPFSAYPFVMTPAADPIVRYVARRMSADLSDSTGKDIVVTPEQVLLRWNAMKGFASIPRSSRRENLESNLKALELPSLNVEYMDLLESLQFLVQSPVSKAVPDFM